ncbi:MAG: hypothetical protein C7B45_17195 [Sulfobacillus acidophilus]|uniref:Uncharacterized protein n=1 Tax=Sulfobacillus acidophilus TaxID=53633 RepID=A0A2T2WCL7_9FIRM|nr:MAG: hypothetical protein C7B45_17195 [Sulfobacillus acidophilus]
MPYIIGTLITIGLFLLLVDKRRIREFYPTYLFMIGLGHIGDFVFVYQLKLYDYTDPLMPRHLIMLLIAIGGYGPLAVLYIQFVQKYNVWVFRGVSAGVMALIEWVFFGRTGELTYYRWHLLVSFVSYVGLAVFTYGQYRWYTPPAQYRPTP